MKMRIDIARAAELLRENDDILVLCHAHPDGDTLGCGYALMHMLQLLGKRCRLECADEIAPKYSFMLEGLADCGDFEPKFITAVDVADIKLLSDASAEKYGGRVDLCIDHHGSNTEYAKAFCVDASAAACAEMLCPLADELGVEITPAIANCLYTGISTDTGCFKFSNTTARTHILAARLMECGANVPEINRVFFETKSLSYVKLERFALDSLKMYFGGQCAVITVTQEMFAKSGSNDSETDAIPGLSRQIEGVKAGVTIKESKDGTFKISVRTHAPIDASEICRPLGGGGHVRAAGCRIRGSRDEAEKLILEQVEKALKESEK